MGAKLDINVARMIHLNWELDLEALIEKRQPIENLTSYQDCDLGLWLHGDGLHTLGSFSAIRQLVMVHKRFHETVDSVAKMTSDHDKREGLSEVRTLSREVIYLLTQAEMEYLNAHDQGIGLNQPMFKLWDRLFGRREEKMTQQAMLDVSHARLLHLKWVQSMPQAFRNHGHGMNLDTAELCSLGVWIHAVGLKKYGQIQEINQLDETHQAFHEYTANTLTALRNKQDSAATHTFAEVHRLSREIIYLLSLVEYKLLDSSAVKRTKTILPFFWKKSG
ncbi:MAG: CZB domain-containing protein [Magnetococcales bacterium]|nr:CZB domain-containing protein [Magnetococcales bacterium]